MTEPEPERHFVIKFCDWCRIAVPVDVREGPAFDEEHRHDDT